MLLVAMGAKISGAGTETIVVEGVDALHGATHPIIPDRIEAGTYALAAAATRGDVVVRACAPEHLSALTARMSSAGVRIDTIGDTLRVRAEGPLLSNDVATAPYPGFPTDLQAQWMALAAGMEGVATITETIFENRFQHVAELVRMGAKIRLEGRWAVVEGPSRLSGAKVMASDLRASAALAIAALTAEGETTIDRVYHLDRGYAKMEEKLVGLGARSGGRVSRRVEHRTDDCLFCKIAAGEIPSKKVYSDDNVYAFHDIAPKAPTHVLIIPAQAHRQARRRPRRRRGRDRRGRDARRRHRAGARPRALPAGREQRRGRRAERLPSPLPPPRRPPARLAARDAVRRPAGGSPSTP